MIPTPVSAVAPLSFHKSKGTPQSTVIDASAEVTMHPGMAITGAGGGPGVAGEMRVSSMDTLGSEGLDESGSFDESQFENPPGSLADADKTWVMSAYFLRY